MIDLGIECNLKCKYCCAKVSPNKFNILETINNFFLKYINDNCELIQIGFRSQEMFSNIKLLQTITNIFYLNSLIFNYKFQIATVTNGTYLHLKKVQEYCNKYKNLMYEFVISLDGDKEVQETNRPGSWKKIMNSWYFLKQYTKNKIAINSVYSHETHNTYGESLITLLKNHDDIISIFSCFNDNNDYTFEDVDNYIIQLKIVLNYILYTDRNIKLNPLFLIKDTAKRDNTLIILNENINIQTCNSICLKCTNYSCDLYFIDTMSIARCNVQKYLYSKLRKLYTKYAKQIELKRGLYESRY
jgi:sulfatase maturation enzyme AslB (radical SAM superfamily)